MSKKILVVVSEQTRQRLKTIANANKEIGIKPDTIGGVVDNLVEAASCERNEQ